MATYLLTWNPERFSWTELPKQIARIARDGRAEDRWGCGTARQLAPGDRVFLVRLGREPKGIVGSGYVTSSVYQAAHWSDARRFTNYVDLDFDRLLDGETGPILGLDLLRGDSRLAAMNWLPRSSGQRIPDEIAAALEQAWANHTAPISAL